MVFGLGNGLSFGLQTRFRLWLRFWVNVEVWLRFIIRVRLTVMIRVRDTIW